MEVLSEETSSEAVSSEESKVVSKNIADVGSVAQKWIFLPILTALASIAVLVVVNVRAAKQRRLERAAQQRRSRRMPVSENGVDDAYEIYSDSSNMRSQPKHSAPPRGRRSNDKK